MTQSTEFQVRKGSNWLQCGHEDWYTHWERAMRCPGTPQVAIRRLERRRHFGQSYGIRRHRRVSHFVRFDRYLNFQESTMI